MSPRLVPQPTAVSLRRLFPNASFVGSTDIVASDLSHDSRQCRPGYLFAAVPGVNANGADHVGEAVANGATTLLCNSPIPEVDIPQCVVANVREAYAKLCQATRRFPSRHLQIAGVTGTNGKTTTTWLLRSIFRAAGFTTGLSGTIEVDSGNVVESAAMTTPDANQFSALLAEMVENNCTHAAVELSSHALEQSRVAGISLAAAVITNVTHDHLDYHGNQEAYCKSKARIAELCDEDQPFLVNADDEGCEIVAGMLPRNFDVQRFGIHCSADVRGKVLTSSRQGSRYEVSFAGQSFEVRSPLIGEHNISNGLAAASVALQLGIGPDAIAQGIANVRRVPGRLQMIRLNQPFDVFVDYAHTPDALTSVLNALRPLVSGKLICVTGAGGDRDKSKRQPIGQSVSTADVVVLTSDNPRSEDPGRIIEQIKSGIQPGIETHVNADRTDAIRMAIELASPNDAVLIAGKGHETIQHIGDERQPFDDSVVARRCIARVMANSAATQAKKGA